MSTKIEFKKNKRFDTLAKKLSLVSDSNRLKIMCIVFNKAECCVTDIAEELGLHIAVVSHHLQSLSKAGLLEAKRNGKKICYSLSADVFLKDLKNLICKHK